MGGRPGSTWLARNGNGDGRGVDKRFNDTRQTQVHTLLGFEDVGGSCRFEGVSMCHRYPRKTACDPLNGNFHLNLAHISHCRRTQWVLGLGPCRLPSIKSLLVGMLHMYPNSGNGMPWSRSAPGPYAGPFILPPQ